MLLPLVALLTAAGSILLRRGFGLHSGVYDILLGVANTTLYYSSLGIPTSLTKFLPEIDAARGREAVRPFLRRASVARMLLLAPAILAIHVWATELADRLALGEHGAPLLRIVTALVVVRAVYDLEIKTLQAFLAHLPANLLVLLQSLLEPAMIAACLVLGYGIGGVVGALSIGATLLAVIGGGLVRSTLRGAPPSGRPAVAPASVPLGGDDPEGVRGPAEWGAAGAGSQSLWRFSLFTYVYELSTYLAGPAFARLALATTLGRPEPVALFSTGYQIAFMSCGLVVSGFRGVYRPMFAHLRASSEPARLREAFEAVSKVQVALLAPVGVGLVVMAPDFLLLLYGEPFTAAAPVTRLLVALLFTETAFNLGVILLSIDERYRAVLGAQAWLLATAPLFVWFASSAGLAAAAVTLGTGRVLVVVSGYLVCRRVYGVRFPWAFAARVAAVSAAMGAVVSIGRTLWPTSWLEAAALSTLGFVIFVAGARAAALLGPAEVELVRRS
ncbi:MAG: lipopolysaccharide biosynthesis protein, partial [Candidatus Binatia bacterium]